MKLTSKGRYTLTAVLDLASNSNGRPVRLRDISERQGISLHYLEQLFRKLRNGGVVKSVRGPGGGYVLAAEESTITIKQILDSAGEATSYLSDKLAVTENSTTEAVATSNYFGVRLDQAVQEKLNSDTLAALLEGMEGLSNSTAE